MDDVAARPVSSNGDHPDFKDSPSRLKAPKAGRSEAVPIAAKLGSLIETVVAEGDGSIFWPILAELEAMHCEAGRLRTTQRQAMRARLDLIRERMLFDIAVIATDIAVGVERRLAAEEIIGGSGS